MCGRRMQFLTLDQLLGLSSSCSGYAAGTKRWGALTKSVINFMLCDVYFICTDFAECSEAAATAAVSTTTKPQMPARKQLLPGFLDEVSQNGSESNLGNVKSFSLQRYCNLCLTRQGLFFARLLYYPIKCIIRIHLNNNTGTLRLLPQLI